MVPICSNNFPSTIQQGEELKWFAANYIGQILKTGVDKIMFTSFAKDSGERSANCKLDHLVADLACDQLAIGCAEERKKHTHTQGRVKS